MKKYILNWRTTLAGLTTVLAGIVKIVNKDVVGGLTLVATGLGLVHSKDAE
jgi:hypothetical protein